MGGERERERKMREGRSEDGSKLDARERKGEAAPARPELGAAEGSPDSRRRLPPKRDESAGKDAEKKAVQRKRADANPEAAAAAKRAAEARANKAAHHRKGGKSNHRRDGGDRQSEGDRRSVEERQAPPAPPAAPASPAPPLRRGLHERAAKATKNSKVTGAVAPLAKKPAAPVKRAAPKSGEPVSVSAAAPVLVKDDGDHRRRLPKKKRAATKKKVEKEE